MLQSEDCTIDGGDVFYLGNFNFLNTTGGCLPKKEQKLCHGGLKYDYTQEF